MAGYLLKKNYFIKKLFKMILQVDTQNNTLVHKWYSIEMIKQKTSYDADDIKKAIAEKTEMGGYIWLEFNNK